MAGGGGKGLEVWDKTGSSKGDDEMMHEHTNSVVGQTTNNEGKRSRHECEREDDTQGRVPRHGCVFVLKTDREQDDSAVSPRALASAHCSPASPREDVRSHHQDLATCATHTSPSTPPVATVATGPKGSLASRRPRPRLAHVRLKAHRRAMGKHSAWCCLAGPRRVPLIRPRPRARGPGAGMQLFPPWLEKNSR